MPRWSVFAVCGLALMLSACQSEGVAGPEADLSLQENRGTPLTTINLSPHAGIQWGRSDEIVYVSSDAVGQVRHVRTARVADGTDRIVLGPAGVGTNYAGVRVSRGGRDLYVLQQDANTGAGLYALIDGRAPVLLTQNTLLSSGNPFSFFGSNVVTTSDARYAAFIVFAGDSVRLLDTHTGAVRHLATGCRALLAMSPSDSEVLCQREGVISVISLADGTRRTVTLPSGVPGQQPAAANWTQDGMQFVYVGAGFLTELVNTTTARRDTLFRMPSVPYNWLLMPNAEAMSWSPDGSRVALPITRSCFSCSDGPVEQTEIMIYDLRSRVSTRAAVVNGRIGQVVFSPEGTRLAYLMESPSIWRVYVVTAP